ncbi:ABC transporter permease [Geotoga petraea]|jgi:putative ABC transport system permease protein|uniref:FtsX-like permease family protein n=1 Tax=Geotoga petraea TaxID=28234 RepID=A0A1G6K5V0_9BACT|nr:ABC transporter permease [Geotoga petraea]MDK2945785.1 putative transport system permease protein [Geotoga sp.]TGG88432.1 FtsX-like permease family protein [Geotoga petraea]SDC26303.1 putative ABC transport system permease protein [Geotoga petraea]
MEILRETIRSLVSNKMRTFLSMLGIIIGITSVIAVISLGQGTTQNLTDTVSSLGSNVLIITPGRTTIRAGTSSSNNTLTVNDANDIKNYAPSVKSTAPVLQGSFLLKNNDLNINSTLLSSNNDVFSILKLELSDGRFYNFEDIEQKRNVMVIGYEIANELFPNENPIGKNISVMQNVSNSFTRKINFEIIGVIKETGSKLLYNIDTTVLIPISTGDARLFQTNGNVPQILASAQSQELSNSAQIEIDTILYNKFGSESFNIMSQDAILDVIGNITGIMSFILVAIAAISLVVGGIGIMNIMLVSVSERTKEIGIKMAIGASRRRILFEFIFESIAITFIAGIIGIIFGILLSNGIASLAREYSLSALISWQSILSSFGISVAVGLFFGIYPANKASKLSPIEALRYE